jgi:hypothetical protein
MKEKKEEGSQHYDSDLPVYRLTDLPRGDLQGGFFLTRDLLLATRDALVSFALAGIRDGGHEGIAYWAGRSVNGITLFLQVYVPEAEHGPGSVHVSAHEIGRVARHARRDGLGILCQVHSHPGSDARHSDGDDHLVLLPFDGMLSIVAPHFGVELTSIENTQVHQFQRDRWVLCSNASVRTQMTVMPSIVDLRVKGS